ncbi:glycine zipper 2TM domain-containing protein [Caenimonas sedimenti]|uniref:Glycine zipper 2TM domain-containing protein n=1 Tax=Caenimonas sedimenti TaxID=2596921 RepID=A0A562ZX58_9BURK|nr:glycine zipper 2TM domain-containing protein [Caenimonas sedimenti]TWO72971.1 glycine zipper 2TM domain-containing protein [Caenimonas sedimenti]
MKKSALSLALGLVALGAGAQEVGTVLSSTPVVQQVQVPRQVCSQPVVIEQQTSGGGGLLGALIGGGIGSQIGGGSGRTAGAIIGTVGGAILGNQIEANNNRQAYAQPQCTTQVTYENRTVGYNVTYEYGGRQHTVQMPYDPGPTIRLRVSPMVQNDEPQELMPQAGAPHGPVVVAPGIQHGVQVVPQVQAAPVIVQQPQVVVPAGYPVYPAAYPVPVYRPYYPPVGISLNLGYSRGWGGHRHHRH